MDPAAQMQEMLLGQLRDIRLPADVGWWPLAPGWWAVAALLFVIILAAIVLFLRYRAATQYRREARSKLAGHYELWGSDLQTDRYLFEASHVLRQVAVQVCGRERVSAATGEDWLNELAAMSTRPVPDSLRHALVVQAYQPAPELNVDQAHQDILDWLEGVSRRHYDRHRNQPGPTTPGEIAHA